MADAGASGNGGVVAARRAAMVAAALGVLHAASSAYWACGGTWLVATLGARITSQFAGRAWLLWPVVAVKLVVALAPLRWLGRRSPAARGVRVLSWLAAVVLVVWGGMNTLVGNLVLLGAVRPSDGYDRQAMIGHAWLWDPLFLAWGVALVVALMGSRRRRRPRR